MFNRSIIELSLDSWTWHLPNFERADKPGSTPGDAVFCFFAPFFFFFCFFFFLFGLFFNTIFPFGLFFFIITADPAGHALGSIYILSLSPEYYFGKGISRVLDLHTGQAYGQKKPQAVSLCPLSSQTAEFFSMLVDIMTNNTQYTTNCTYLHPTPTSDQQAKVKPVPLYIVLIINIVTLKSPLGQLPQKTIKRNLLLVFGI